MDNVAKISSGVSHTLALKDDGSLWAWGDNRSGQAGIGLSGSRKPVKVLEGVKTPVNPFSEILEERGVYNFAILSEEDFPRGTWTVNQLIKKYGPLKRFYIDYWAEMELGFLYAEFDGITVKFPEMYGEALTRLSFYQDSLGYGEYPLSKKEQDMELEILALYMRDKDTVLPYGIKIGESTKTQVFEKYPMVEPRFSSVGNTYYDSWGNGVYVYYYAFFQDHKIADYEIYWNGFIAYKFDENDLLEQVKVQWFASWVM
jgi:hypothetical protein